MDEGTGVLLVFVLAFVFVGWYIVGGLWQRRTAGAYVRRLGLTAQALSESRAMPRVRWLGQAGFQLTVDDAVAPYTKLAIVTLLMPREAIALWLVALLRRRGDSIVVRADLREKPRADATLAAAAPVRELSLSRGSPNVIAALDAGWVRAHEPAEIAAAIRRTADAIAC